MDSLSISKGKEEASGDNINGESESHLHMGPKLYAAAAEGNVEPFKVMAKDVIESLVMATNNTILHINIIAQSQYKTNTMVSSTMFAEEILVICPSLLLQLNARGDTPLHVAAKCNRMDMAKRKLEETVWQELDKHVLGVRSSGVTVGSGCTNSNSNLHYRVHITRWLQESNQGTAILSEKSAFQAFVVTDAIAMVLSVSAMVLSVSAVFVHFIMSIKVFKKLVILFILAFLFTLIAMIAMVIAFITGIYATLSPSLGLAIPTCFIGLSFVLLIFFQLRKPVRLKFLFNVVCLLWQFFWLKVFALFCTSERS